MDKQVLLLASIVAFTVLALLAFYLYERRRSKNLLSIAQQLGFQFLGDVQSAILSGSNFKLRESGGATVNLIKGERRGIQIEVFGYDTDADNSSITTTVGAYCCDSLKLPEFELCPENLSCTSVKMSENPGRLYFLEGGK